MKRVLVALIAAAVLPAAGPPLTGDAIFDAAQKVAVHATYPVYASYTVNVAFTDGTQRVHDTWPTVEDIRTATVLASLFSSQEVANPATPHGTDIDIQAFGNVNAAKEHDPIGNVAFAIDQTFGVTPPRAYLSGSALNTTPVPADGMFRVIGGAVGPDRLYIVQLVDTVVGDRGQEYHLKLTPRFDPNRDRLRELWIATDTMTLDAAVVMGVGDRPPTSKVLWRVSFTTVNGAPYLQRETALAPLDYGTRGRLQNVTVDFSDMQPSDNYPVRFRLGQQPQNPLRDP